jgi:hypothetical protein
MTESALIAAYGGGRQKSCGLPAPVTWTAAGNPFPGQLGSGFQQYPATAFQPGEFPPHGLSDSLFTVYSSPSQPLCYLGLFGNLSQAGALPGALYRLYSSEKHVISAIFSTKLFSIIKK